MTVDDDYTNAPFIPDSASYPERWAADAAEFRKLEEALGRAWLNIGYGETERQKFDLFYPAGRPEGLLVFVHGGYWRAFHRSDWSHFASGATARGWTVAMPSYDLAPGVRIAEITQQVARAIADAAGRVEGPIALTGHSAGGHLVARMACADVDLAPEVATRIRRILPISPLGDLHPLMQTTMNEDFRIDAEEAACESPALCKDRRAIATTVWVGGAERPGFLAQARQLAAAWDAPLRIAPDRHHFDVIDPLLDPESEMLDILLGAGG